MQTMEIFIEILRGNCRFLGPGLRLVTPYHCTYLTSLICILMQKSIVFGIPRLLTTNNRLALPPPIGSDYV